MKTPEQAARDFIASWTHHGFADHIEPALVWAFRQRDREVYEAGQIAMRNRAAQIADDFWGVDTAAGRIRALTPEKML